MRKENGPEKNTGHKLLFSELDRSIEPAAEHKFCYEFSAPHLKDKSILDAGCWNGKYLNLIRGSVSGMSVGVDIEEKALGVALRNVPGPKFLAASVFGLPFKDKTFDAVTLWAVIEHITAKGESRALGEIHRVLKEDGSLFISTPSGHWLARVLDPAYFLTGHRHYGRAGLEKILGSAGFKIEEFRVKGGICDCLSTIMFYISKHILRRACGLKTLKKLAEREYAPDFNGFNVVFLSAKKKN
ncbi:MAG: class I SAM-dependent methyltransferase [Candidatus Omnitrophica bacterium]|nr:class I SAM-dependent methyltransferase [Candidatus Omnitrophota bacterium]MDD5552658.1 class I SAM-dependent methyltransferase [Candidatus Omnitrophota bacterium]